MLGTVYRTVHTVVLSTVHTVVYSAVYSVVFSTVYSILLVKICRKQVRGFFSGNKSANQATFKSGYSLLYIKVYTVQYSVHLTFQYSICVWDVQCLSEM